MKKASKQRTIKIEKRRVTVTDVAQLAHVGTSTVSRFLRGIQVRPKVAERVARAVKELAYKPDEFARALRSGRSRTIGLILPKVSNFFFSQSVQLIEEEARQRGCTVVLLTHGDRLEQQLEDLATLRRYRADGVILTAAPGTNVRSIRSAFHDAPVVAFDGYISSSIDSVLLNNRESARKATEHLLGHGYANIACVTGRPEIYSFQERMAGYTEAMSARTLPPRLITAPDYEQLYSLLAEALQGKDRPDALLSLSDFSTRNILTIYQRLGLKSAEHLPLLAFDDIDYAPLVNPSLTVIRQPIAEMVRNALSLLFSRIEETAPKKISTVFLPGELIRRRSCGCVES
ncbi:MAG: LacI family DNA-binding transcriptional regulator [Terracidiphilus sp.]|jgi:LacI family transcriptional regulator